MSLLTYQEARPWAKAIREAVLLKRMPPGYADVPFVKAPRKPGEDEKAKRASEFLVGYAPGSVPEVMEPGRAKLIKAGSEIEFQVHYTANGTAGVDRSRVGLIFATEPPREREMTVS